MDWITASVVGVIASTLGDMIAYAVGRLASERLLERWGRWLGYASRRQARAVALFERWGALTILLTRTLISHLSSIVSLLAGPHRYRIAAFLALNLASLAASSGHSPTSVSATRLPGTWMPLPTS
jgi:membrane protein DedA with SNARE-associated domain